MERQDVVVIFLMLFCKVLYLSPSHIYTHSHTESDRPCDCTCFTSPPLYSDTNVTWQRGSFFCHWGRCTGPWTTHSNSNSHSCRGCDINVTHCLYSWADTGSPNFSSEQWSSREAHTPLSFIHLTNTYTHTHKHTHTHVGSNRSRVWHCRHCFSLCEFECFDTIFLGKQWHATKMPHIRPWNMFMANSKLKD